MLLTGLLLLADRRGNFGADVSELRERGELPRQDAADAPGAGGRRPVSAAARKKAVRRWSRCSATNATPRSISTRSTMGRGASCSTRWALAELLASRAGHCPVPATTLSIFPASSIPVVASVAVHDSSSLGAVRRRPASGSARVCPALRRSHPDFVQGDAGARRGPADARCPSDAAVDFVEMAPIVDAHAEPRSSAEPG